MFFGEKNLNQYWIVRWRTKTKYGIIIEKWIVFCFISSCSQFSSFFCSFFLCNFYHWISFPHQIFSHKSGADFSTEHTNIVFFLRIFPTYLQDVYLKRWIFAPIQQIIVCTYSVFLISFLFLFFFCDCTNAVAERSVLW